ncbi:MAG: hypothetical protein JRG89_03825 [Deltaproteobacteria bacterium]|nr:hypothetical protein [Deltaproteobacteria bacterium]
MFATIRFRASLLTAGLLFLCISLSSHVVLAEESPDYGINIKKMYEEFLARPEAEKEKIVQDFSRLLNSSMTIMRSNHYLGIQT